MQVLFSYLQGREFSLETPYLYDITRHLYNTRVEQSLHRRSWLWIIVNRGDNFPLVLLIILTPTAGFILSWVGYTGELHRP